MYERRTKKLKRRGARSMSVTSAKFTSTIMEEAVGSQRGEFSEQATAVTVHICSKRYMTCYASFLHSSAQR